MSLLCPYNVLSYGAGYANNYNVLGRESQYSMIYCRDEMRVGNDPVAILK